MKTEQHPGPFHVPEEEWEAVLKRIKALEDALAQANNNIQMPDPE